MQKSVIEYLQSTVSRFPAKIAVKDSEMSITFGDLWRNDFGCAREYEYRVK